MDDGYNNINQDNSMNQNNMNQGQNMNPNNYNNMNQDGYYNGGYNQGQNMEPVMSIGQWLIISLVMSIPCVNIVMLFVWGFGNGPQNRANYCKAALILWIIGVALSVILSAVVGMSATDILNSGYGA